MLQMYTVLWDLIKEDDVTSPASQSGLELEKLPAGYLITSKAKKKKKRIITDIASVCLKGGEGSISA